MRILKGDFLRAFPFQVVNIHPSLLPAFPGLEAWKQALDYGVKVTGCTVHYVDQGIDSGPIIGQETVEVKADDSPDSLHERIQEAERRLYSTVVQAIVEGRIEIRGRMVVWHK
jgi:phosphoribosylglycinamide formyltransferase-1